MRIEENILILDQEISDDMVDQLIENINNEEVESIQIDTDNISSLAIQQLLCVAKEKKMIINNSFIEKFFENINYL